jgi:hypothetical protein
MERKIILQHLSHEWGESGMRIFADIGIELRLDLESTAKIIGEILKLNFLKDIEGKYEEYPAYIAKSEGVEYSLLGPPEPEFDIRDEPVAEFQLMVDTISETEEEECDVSEDISGRILADGRINCWPLVD